MAYLVCNFLPPNDGQPAQLTHDDVVTLFHEFGHGLHHMLTRVDYPSLAGINGVAWDAVELPSQFLENYAWHPEVLQRISKHVHTGAPLPEDMQTQLIATRSFHAGLQTMRQIEFALFDFRMHAEYDPAKGGRVREILAEVRREVAVVPVPPWNRFPNSFGHIFAGGYAAGYYSYKWAEVLAADAFSAFEETGVFDHATAQRFLESILSRGGSRDPLDAFVEFRGRRPDVRALLKQHGIAASDDTSRLNMRPADRRGARRCACAAPLRARGNAVRHRAARTSRVTRPRTAAVSVSGRSRVAIASSCSNGRMSRPACSSPLARKAGSRRRIFPPDPPLRAAVEGAHAKSWSSCARRKRSSKRTWTAKTAAATATAAASGEAAAKAASTAFRLPSAPRQRSARVAAPASETPPAVAGVTESAARIAAALFDDRADDAGTAVVAAGPRVGRRGARRWLRARLAHARSPHSRQVRRPAHLLTDCRGAAPASFAYTALQAVVASATALRSTPLAVVKSRATCGHGAARSQDVRWVRGTRASGAALDESVHGVAGLPQGVA